jgi:hypothetical protein
MKKLSANADNASVAYTNSVSFEGSQIMDRNEYAVPITPVPLINMNKLNEASDNQSYKTENTEKKSVTYTSKFTELDDYFVDDDVVNEPFVGASENLKIRRKYNKSPKKEVRKPGAGMIPSARSDHSKTSNHDNEMLVLPSNSNLFVDPKPMGQLSPQRHDMLVPPSLRAAALASTAISHFKHLTAHSADLASTAMSRTGGNIIDNAQGSFKPRNAASSHYEAPSGVMVQSYRSNRSQRIGDTSEGDPIHAPTRGTGTVPQDVNMSRLPGQHMDQELKYQNQFPLWHA